MYRLELSPELTARLQPGVLYHVETSVIVDANDHVVQTAVRFHEIEQPSIDATLRDRLGHRRRCSWCGVKLRGWQLSMCRLCGGADDRAPCFHGSRWDEQPDAWRWF